MVRAMSRFTKRGSIETIGDFVTVVRDTVPDDDSLVDALCHADEATPHRTTVDGETYHFLCFFDAIVLAHLEETTITVRTESPAGEEIEIRASPDGEIDVTPPDAVMSVGVSAEEEPSDEDLTPTDAYDSFCPYWQAFPTRETYEHWAAGVDAYTVGIPLAAGVPIAAALAE